MPKAGESYGHHILWKLGVVSNSVYAGTRRLWSPHYCRSGHCTYIRGSTLKEHIWIHRPYIASEGMYTSLEIWTIVRKDTTRCEVNSSIVNHCKFSTLLWFVCALYKYVTAFQKFVNLFKLRSRSLMKIIQEFFSLISRSPQWCFLVSSDPQTKAFGQAEIIMTIDKKNMAISILI